MKTNKRIPLFFSFGGMMLLSASNIHAQKNPNIVIILADDLGWGDVGFHGSKISTPNIDKLSDKGVIFDRFYTAPISSPTRAGLLTGRYPNRFGIRKAVIPPWREDGLDETEETIADVLKTVGYENRAIIGKWHLGHSRKVYYPLNRGFNYFYGHLNGAIDYFTHKREEELDWHKNRESCYDEGYSTDLLANEAVNYVKAQRNSNPFFMYVAFNAPHGPLQAKEEDIAFYANNPNFAKDPHNMTRVEKDNCTYAAMVTCLDRGIGRIYDELEQSGKLDNTLFLFFSDNGQENGSSGPLRGKKFQEWDGGLKSPAFMIWPQVLKKPRTIEQVTGFVDILPTIREITGVKKAPKKALDGISILPILKGEHEFIARDLYLGCGAVVNQNYKLILPGQNSNMKAITEDYFIDYRTDPYEKKSNPAANPSELKRMKEIALKYDAIIPVVQEADYGAGKGNFVAPKEWKVTKP